MGLERSVAGLTVSSELMSLRTAGKTAV
ncbi:rCG30897 [Rattus norvegicus]|uniref:RCG30897 n=1 Tax=Rattus norvegicus TaxID=10116 RepID=A6IUV1_RAT|nr:rCG30897 [Rattus norvegicus]